MIDGELEVGKRVQEITVRPAIDGDVARLEDHHGARAIDGKIIGTFTTSLIVIRRNCMSPSSDFLIGPVHVHTNVLSIDVLGQIICHVFLPIDFLNCQVAPCDSILHPSLIDRNLPHLSQSLSIGESLCRAGIRFHHQIAIDSKVLQHTPDTQSH